jgi:hypothetical protein
VQGGAEGRRGRSTRTQGRRGSRHGWTRAWHGCMKKAAPGSRRRGSGSTWLHRAQEVAPTNGNGSNFKLARGGRGMADPWLWRLRLRTARRTPEKQCPAGASTSGRGTVAALRLDSALGGDDELRRGR